MVPLASYVVASQGISPVSQRPLRCVEDGDGQRFGLVVFVSLMVAPGPTYLGTAYENVKSPVVFFCSTDHPPDPLFYVPALC